MASKDNMKPQTFTLEELFCFLKSYPGVLFLKDDQGRYCYTSHICDVVSSAEDSGIIGKNE